MKRLILSVAILALLLCAHPAALGTEPEDLAFADVPAGSWFEAGVMTCARSGVMVGTGEDTFSPKATLTDAECAMLAYRLYDMANGGDGSLLEMPEDYGYIKLVSDDGSYTHEGYAGDGNAWWMQNVYYASDGYRLCPVGDDAPAPGPATVTFGGKEYRGAMEQVYRGSGRYESDWFIVFQPEDAAFNELMMEAYRVPPPDCWWADLVYTAVQTGREDVLPYYIYGREASRAMFTETLGSAVALPKRFDVPIIPDGGERGWGGWYDAVYPLYEAGIIGGVDAYGTFEGDATLTRAEAAVMVARVLDESQRLTQPPKPMPELGEGYTLTYLMDGSVDRIYDRDTYPYYVVEEFWDISQPHPGHSYKGFLHLDGTFEPWPVELPADLTVPNDWENWGGLEIFDEYMTLGWKPYYRWSDGSPATEYFDLCGKIGPDGMGFVQKDGKIYRIQFDEPAQKAD